ncbi:unnamed protein product [Rotaria sp. Silwood2]|nr:unnamed protein product [Rotaria sp. Silwood2]
MSITDERAKQAFPELEQMIHDLYSKPLPVKLYRRARREYRKVKRLQKLLNRLPDIIIRRIDKGEGFYFGNKSIMEYKTVEYMNKTEAYQEVTTGRCPLSDILRSTEAVLDYLLKKKAISKAQRDKLLSNVNTLELAHLYTLPKVHKFITGDVENLYTMIPREGGINALIRFLDKCSKYRKIGPFNIDMILKMARLILDTNYFAYKNEYYHQKRGGAMGSVFTQVFANIYMLEWEQDLIRYQASKHEIYGRYVDDIFMTTNEPFEELIKKLEEAQQKDNNIKIKSTINDTFYFLDITITNANGQLKTSIYHKPTADPYFLPYTSDHPHRIHRNIPYTALIRAARLCNNLHDFHMERLRIKVSLLLNNYPPKFIKNQFFQVNKADILIKRFDEKTYHQLHYKLLYQPSKHELELKAMKNDPVLFPPILQQKPWNARIMCVRHTFESRPISTFSRQFMTWWKNHYQYPESLANSIQIRLIPKTNRTLQNFLIRKKPRRQILTKLEPTT